MKLIHRTNYWGRRIEPRKKDREVPFDCIWTQAVPESSRNRGGCCRGFGRRTVRVDEEHLTEVHDEKWNLYKVSENQGRNQRHYFYKFALIASSSQDYTKDDCEKLGWVFLGSVNASGALTELD
eukprot:1032307-Ditylum_brightwellii.AAC.1